MPVVDCGGDAFRPAGAAVRGDDSRVRAVLEKLASEDAVWRKWGRFHAVFGALVLPTAYCLLPQRCHHQSKNLRGWYLEGITVGGARCVR